MSVKVLSIYTASHISTQMSTHACIHVRTQMPIHMPAHMPMHIRIDRFIHPKIMRGRYAGISFATLRAVQQCLANWHFNRGDDVRNAVYRHAHAHEQTHVYGHKYRGGKRDKVRNALDLHAHRHTCTGVYIDIYVGSGGDEVWNTEL